MYKKFRLNLLLLLTIFALIIILFLSYIDMKRNNSQLKENYIERITLAEMNVKTALTHWNEEYKLLDYQVAEQMYVNSLVLLDKYNDNPNFETWDFDELKQQFGMDVYVINKENTVIYSSFKPDIGLDFNECCESFSKLLTERREKGEFVHDVIDLQKDVGELKKFSYMPTEDGEYILELSYELEKDPAFKKFGFVTVMNELKGNYPFIKSVSIFNEDYYEFYREKIDSLRSSNNRSCEWLDTSSTMKENNYMLLNCSEKDHSTKVVAIVYDNGTIVKALEESLLYFYLQVVGASIVAVGLIIFIFKIIKKPLYLAFHDRLTGLKNRAAFENEVQRLLEYSHRKFGMLLLDFDNFKRINDTLGHGYGDLFLKFVAEYIQSMLPEKALFARFGGDEFIILLKDIKNREEMELLANKLIQSFKKPQESDVQSELFKKGFQIIRQCNVTLSIGGAMYPNDGKDGETLYKKSDMALYYSKEHGKCKYTYCKECMKEKD